MAIDFSRFVGSENVILPIVNGVGKIHSRVINSNVPNGWYLVEIFNEIKVIRPATQLEIFKTLDHMPKFRVYAFGNEGIPINFDNFNRKGFDESVRVYFLEQPIFTIVNLAMWEDMKFYFAGVEPKLQANMMTNLRQLSSKNESITGIKGITPEIRYYYLLINLQKQALESIEKLKQLKLSQEEMRKRMAEMKSSLEFRIKDAVDKAGGEFVSMQKRGAKYLVVWKVGNQEVKSIIKDDLRIDSAGFCLSGADKQHSLHSIINLAKLFKRTQPLYITRE